MAIMQVGPGGIETISGALKRPKKIDGHNHGNYVVAVHRKAASENPNCQRVYTFSPDRYKRANGHYSSKELAIHTRFTEVSAMVKARSKDLMKVTEDQENFAAQLNTSGGKRTMRAYLWKVCGQEYDAEHNG